MLIRDEQPEDIDSVRDLTERAFGQADEAQLVDALRRDGNNAISLVATEGDIVVGHVLLSPMYAPFRALGLAPLSVLPDHQNRGIGSALSIAALERARVGGWDAVFVLGDNAYYERFGFRADLAAGFECPYAGSHFMVAPLRGALPVLSGRVDYAPAFAAL
ncbi:MAG TPA: N-acetyltransferase [Caulobacteraceae bacterium]|jgi:putative acetyltransferase|nr:N-acetyltransferase [Caulobacteraceae bacterium]